MTKRTASKSASLVQLPADSLRHATGGEETKPTYTLTIKFAPEYTRWPKASGAIATQD